MHRRSSITGALALAVASTALAQPSFQGLGDLKGGAFDSSAQGISPDGGTVVGMSAIDGGFAAFKWTPKDGIQQLDSFDGVPRYSIAQDASLFGEVIVGTSNSTAGSEACRWTSEGIFGLGRLPGSNPPSYAGAVTPNGLVIVGQGQSSNSFLPWRWTSSGYHLLEKDGYGAATDISDDGSVTVGTYGADATVRRGFIWRSNGDSSPIGTIAGRIVVSQLHAVTPSGHAATGYGKASHDAERHEAILWTQQSGLIVLGTLPGTTAATGRGITADASVVVGDGNGGAFIWRRDIGMRSLQAVLQDEYHLDLKGWTLTHAFAITPDGSTIVGRGLNPQGDPEAWVARLTPRCSADFNNDGQLTSSDFFEFLTAFFAGCP